MSPATRQRLRLSGGTELSFIAAGEASKPAVLLLHGFPNSARGFRDVISELSQAAYVIAPDLPGFGESDVLPAPSFPAFGRAILELLDRLAVGPLYIYLHDWGAPVGFHIAMQRPEQVLGLIVQNANAHRTGFGPMWDATLAYWSHPTPENEKAATVHLTFEFTREQYTSGLPSDVAARIPAERWEEDWRVMNLPGRMDTERALIARLCALRCPLRRHRRISRTPAAARSTVWGSTMCTSKLAEAASWMKALPRMEAHVLDAGHLLSRRTRPRHVPLMLDFIGRTERNGDRTRGRE